MKHSRDERGVVVTWLLQVLLVIGVIGLLLFEGGSVAWNYFGTDTDADEIALELSDKVESLTGGQLVLEAQRLAKESGARLVKGSLKVTDGRLELRIKREATTIVISRIDAISSWGKASATGSAPTS